MRRQTALILTVLIALGSVAPIALQINLVQEFLTKSWPGIMVMGVLIVAWGYAVVSTLAQAEPGAFLRSGLIMVYPSASVAMPDVMRLIRGAKRSIKLLDTYYGYFDSLQASLGDALVRNAGLEVRLLIANSNGNLARSRGVYAAQVFSTQVRSAILRIDNFRTQYEHSAPGLSTRVALRSFDVVVPGPMIIVDDRHLFVGTFLQTTGSQNTPMIRMDCHRWWRGGRFKVEVPEQYARTFELVWNSGTHVEP